jgi:hypothetical protein
MAYDEDDRATGPVMAEIVQFLNQEPALLLFMVIGFGYLLGGISPPY